MGYSIQASGELVYTIGAETVRVPESSVKQGEHVQTAPASVKGDDESWSVRFAVSSQGNQFIWHVSYSVGDSGASIDAHELVQSPSGVELVSEPKFVVVETAAE